MLLAVRRFVGNKFVDLLPSSCFCFRRSILRFMGIKVASSARVNIGFRCYGGGFVSIGDNTWIGPNCHIHTVETYEVIIGNDCDVAPEVSFIAGSHEIGYENRRAGTGIAHHIIINDGTWICAKSLVLCRKIGKLSVVASGSVVIDDVEENALYAGIPAKKIKEYK